MPNDLAAIKLDGTIPPKEFQIAVDSFTRLIDLLTIDIAGRQNVDWDMAYPAKGSARIGFRGVSDDAETVQRIVAAYDQVGKAIAARQPVPYSDDVARAARSLVGLINGHVKAVTFFTEESEYPVDVAPPPVAIPKTDVGVGSILGEIRTVSKHNGLSFSLYDRIFERAVRCHVGIEYEDTLRQLWGKFAWVSGTIYRNPKTGQPEEVRDIFDLQQDRSATSGDYRRAIGIIPHNPDDPPSEETIRRIRNA